MFQVLINSRILLNTKIISDETEYGSAEDPLSMHRDGSNEIAPVSEIPYIINDKNVIIAPGQRKIPISILNDEYFEEHACKFGYEAPRDIPISPARYFNQRYFKSSALCIRYR